MRYNILAIIALMLLSGCIQLPIEIDCGLECEDAQPVQQTMLAPDPQPYAPVTENQVVAPPPTQEKKIEEPVQQSIIASRDWKNLASELANQINNELISKNYIDKSVYVKPSCSDPTPCDEDAAIFVQAFKDFLITELVRYGVPTVEAPEPNSVQVAYHARIVRHSQVEKHFFKADTPKFIADEVIITTSILSDNRYIFRKSGVYTIIDKDFWHYQDLGGGATRIPVASNAPSIESPAIESPTVEMPIEPRSILEPAPLQMRQNI